MDFLSELLRAAAFNAILVGRHHLGPRQVLHLPANEHIGFLISRGGACRLDLHKGHTGCRLKTGNIAIFPHAHGCTVQPDDGRSVSLISGHFELDRRVAAPLLARLPELLFLCPQTSLGSDWQRVTLDIISNELDAGAPGSNLLVQRMLEMFFAFASREQLADVISDPGSAGAPRIRARIAPAVAAMHRHPERAWTIAALSRLAHMAPPTFVRQFRNAFFLPPLRYLAQYRMKRAAELLGEGQPLAVVASRCGYHSEAALTRAFKRHYHVSPGRYGRSLRERKR